MKHAWLLAALSTSVLCSCDVPSALSENESSLRDETGGGVSGFEEEEEECQRDCVDIFAIEPSFIDPLNSAPILVREYTAFSPDIFGPLDIEAAGEIVFDPDDYCDDCTFVDLPQSDADAYGRPASILAANTIVVDLLSESYGVPLEEQMSRAFTGLASDQEVRVIFGVEQITDIDEIERVFMLLFQLDEVRKAHLILE